VPREAGFHFADAADELVKGERLAGALGLPIDEDGGARQLQMGGAHAAELLNHPVDGGLVTDR